MTITFTFLSFELDKKCWILLQSSKSSGSVKKSIAVKLQLERLAAFDIEKTNFRNRKVFSTILTQNGSFCMVTSILKVSRGNQNMENTIISSKTGIKLQEIQYKKKFLYVTFSYIVLIPNWTKMGIHKKFKPLKLFKTQIEQNSHSNSHIEQKNSIFLWWLLAPFITN